MERLASKVKARRLLSQWLAERDQSFPQLLEQVAALAVRPLLNEFAGHVPKLKQLVISPN